VVPADAALMIVGLLRVRRRGRRVAGADRMTIEEIVRKVLLDEHAGGGRVDGARGVRADRRRAR